MYVNIRYQQRFVHFLSEICFRVFFSTVLFPLPWAASVNRFSSPVMDVGEKSRDVKSHD